MTQAPAEPAALAATIETQVRSKSDDLLGLWETLVNIDSGSHLHAGVAAVGDVLAKRLEAIGFSVERVRPSEQYAEHRVARRRRPGGRPGRVLLVGHLDTVWQEPIVHEWPFSITDGVATGPGIGDMKGGLVAAMGALEALDTLGIDGPEEITWVLIGDEELGSPSGRSVVEEGASNSDWAICLEPSFAPANVRTSGGGLGVYYVTIHGKTSHITTGEGISAVSEMAHKIQEFEAITRPDRSLLVGVGVARGGVAKQVVPDRAELVLDLRAQTHELLDEGDRRIREITAKTTVAGTTAEVSGGITRPVYPKLEGTERLFQKAKSVAESLGIQGYQQRWSAGGSDGNFVAALGVPILDSAGPICADGCSRRETVVVDTLYNRSAIIGALLATIDPATLRA